MQGRIGRTGRVVAVNLLVFAVLFGLAEGVLRVHRVFEPAIPPARETREGGAGRLSNYDVTLGYRGVRQGGRFRAFKAQGRDTIFDATYTLLPGGWRFVPQPPSHSDSAFVAFFGCSFTFGEGVSDSATLPAAFAAATQGRATVYSRGFKGWGPQSMLALMEAPPNLVALKERRGVAVFTTIDQHIDRVRGTFNIVATWGGNMPLYELDANGVPVRRGSFASVRPLRQFLYWKASHSLVLSRLLSHPWTKASPDDWALMAGIVKRSCDLFAARYESGGCYFVLWPNAGIARQELAPKLRRLGVHVLDYTRLWSAEDDIAKYQIKGDGHPNAAAYRRVAEQLVRDIR
ncbi:MAG: hypothetical protein V4550_01755 [Gemmatimonadota bacterium]